MSNSATPATDLRPPCPVCGLQGTLVPQAKEITEKRRAKFGLLMVLLTILTGGLALLVWLIAPRKKVTVSVDRFMRCSSCGAETR